MKDNAIISVLSSGQRGELRMENWGGGPGTNWHIAKSERVASMSTPRSSRACSASRPRCTFAWAERGVMHGA